MYFSKLCLSQKRGQERETGVIQSEARELISKVIQTCDEVAREKELAFPLSLATEGAAAL
jgi:hypothetical protein